MSIRDKYFHYIGLDVDGYTKVERIFYPHDYEMSVNKMGSWPWTTFTRRGDKLPSFSLEGNWVKSWNILLQGDYLGMTNNQIPIQRK